MSEVGDQIGDQTGDQMRRFANKAGEIRCSFCGKDHAASVWKMIASTGAYICDECIALSIDIIATEVAVFRVAVRRGDGSVVQLKVECGDDFSVTGWCRKCGTLLAGYDVGECLHCGAPLRPEPQPER